MIFSQPLLFTLAVSGSREDLPSKWAHRTAKKRERVHHLLSTLTLPPLLYPSAGSLSEIEICTLEAPSIDWESYQSGDPVVSGKLQPGSPRGRRKRRQVEAFVYICKEIMKGNAQNNEIVTKNNIIVDCGSGAGNLSIPLHELIGTVLAIDVNDFALAKLRDRCSSLQTLCADLASEITLPPSATIVTSLHACGAATDLSIRLAVRHRLPFCMSPCCTAKAMVDRTNQNKYGPAVSSQRSGAPDTITYPRSMWLSTQLDMPSTDYSLLAKIADVGLGPQTPMEQRTHQFLSKVIIELDRLVGLVEENDYVVRLLRIQDHEDYGKAELLLGAPRGSEAAKVIEALLCTTTNCAGK